MNHYSASYDVDMAKKYGLEAAALYNKLVYLSRYTAREDGYCWKTAKELEDELGLSKYQQTRAEGILVKAGIITTKVTYITGTLTRCKHFKVLDFEISESKETSLSIESKETSLSEGEETALSIDNTNTIILNNNHNKKEESSNLDKIITNYTKNESLQQALRDYIKHRKALKSPLTERAMRIAINTLDRLASTDDMKIAIIEQSLFRGWKGFFELKEEPKKQNQAVRDIHNIPDEELTEIERIFKHNSYGGD